jgi:hypothetical protein
MTYHGSCLCGKIHYEVTGEFEQFFFCHCKSCRKDTGSAHAANLFVDGASVVLKKYQPYCIFCKNATDVENYKGKNVCKSCLEELKGGK